MLVPGRDMWGDRPATTTAGTTAAATAGAPAEAGWQRPYSSPDDTNVALRGLQCRCPRRAALKATMKLTFSQQQATAPWGTTVPIRQ